MTTRVERSIQVEVPLRTAYGQWTQFEDFPHFMGGVREVRQLDDRRLHWVAEIAGVRREWEASVLEQVPDQKVAWAATSGATNAGAVRFEAAGPNATVVHLTLEYEPEGVVEQVGDELGVVERQVRSDLERFKALVEDEGYPTGVWRGSVDAGAGVGTPGVADAAASRGDSGKAGVSGTAVAAGVAAVAAGAAAVGAAVAASGSHGTEDKPGPVEIPPSERLAAHASQSAPESSTAALGVPSEVLDEGPEPIAQRTLDPGVGRDEDGTADRPH
ncbi:SRPBCC family protein [Geodermatophilus sp. SYSU D00079]